MLRLTILLTFYAIFRRYGTFGLVYEFAGDTSASIPHSPDNYAPISVCREALCEDRRKIVAFGLRSHVIPCQVMATHAH
jgi:hypothetical protein